MNSIQNQLKTQCSCCKGLIHSTPKPIYNRHGLATIAYRIGNYHSFKDSMYAQLSQTSDPEQFPLLGLKARDPKDISIALIDAFSVMSEVLCFYQEYYANESLLNTAKERLSILEHARLIGYHLHPGVAASGFVAFTLNDPIIGSKNPVLVTQIPQAAKLQSTPGQNEDPQIYETDKEVTARVSWNKIRPRLHLPQLVANNMQSIVVEGISTFIKTGDTVLLINWADEKVVRKVTDVVVDTESHTTQLFISGNAYSPWYKPVGHSGGSFSDLEAFEAVSDTVIQTLCQKSWSNEDLRSYFEIKAWNLDEIQLRLNLKLENESIEASGQVQGFHKAASLFGYNAQKRVVYKSNGTPKKPNHWLEWNSQESPGRMYLDNAYAEILPDSYLILNAERAVLDRRYSSKVQLLANISETEREQIKDVFVISGRGVVYTLEKSIFKLADVKSVTRSAYGISSKSTQLDLADGAEWSDGTSKDLAIIRRANLDVQSEELPLAPVPIVSSVSGNTLTLHKVDLYLHKGQYVSLSGERTDLPGELGGEVLEIKEVKLEGGVSVVIFATNLKHEYVRSSLTINANTTRVSHGESVSEVLGSGDAGLAAQQFVLKQTPLTYATAETPTGVLSTLEIRVNDVLWHEVENFLDQKPESNVYVTKLSDDGSTTVYFGDGVNGARLPTGNDNVVAYYRKGLGLQGSVDAEQLNILLTRPLGVKEAINANKTSGGDDRESLKNARYNAPLGLLTLGRAVSEQDYEDFCRSFAGIEKAKVLSVYQNGVAKLYLSIAGPEGATIEPASKTYQNLLKALSTSGDPFVQFNVRSYQPAFFKLAADLYIHPDYQKEKILKSACKTLREYFSFEARDFAQAVHLSEVMLVLQQLDGVVAVDINSFLRSNDSAGGELEQSIYPILDINTAEILTLDNAPLDEIRVLV